MPKRKKKEETVQEQAVNQEAQAQTQDPKSSMSYAEYTRPLISEIRNSINKVLEEYPDRYTEFDVYNALALSLTLFTSRNIPEELREVVKLQSSAIAKAMADSGLGQAQRDQAYLSAMIIGSARAATTIVGLIEASNIEGQQTQGE